MTAVPPALAATYFQAWKAKRLRPLRAVLADDATSAGRWAAPTTPTPTCRA